ncbi:MAG: hypothetical protein A4E63_02884 [Syntrophorhabdus sp. PtaU1.Bin050]|nr:MAG: hypothetical protein A4E63_02884 [Syntrophorhabdus sp. PtaU1.Bin050]
MSRIERLEPIQIKTECKPYKKQRQEKNEVTLGLLHERYPAAEDKKSSSNYISHCHKDQGQEKKKPCIPAQRLIQGKFEEIKTKILAEDRVDSPGTHAVEKSKHDRPQTAPPQPTQDAAKDGNEQAETLDHPTELAGVDRYPHPIHKQNINGGNLDTRCKKNVGADKETEDNTEGKPCKYLSGQNLQKHGIVTDLAEKKPVNIHSHCSRSEKHYNQDKCQKKQSTQPKPHSLPPCACMQKYHSVTDIPSNRHIVHCEDPVNTRRSQIACCTPITQEQNKRRSLLMVSRLHVEG